MAELSERQLTRAEMQTLLCCPDWSAPFEVMYRRHDLSGEIISPSGQRRILGRLRNLGFVEYGMPNDTYRITPAGLRALSSEQGNE